ncbi:hypothetical protein H7I93_20145 [Mycobacterium nebraskense]|nr:hypothetical protein [Mycobacterium nebraskense]MBI2693787.1 hypothetical protein [Mycobacterium nebraskense]MCV7119449.1 hypothetical protein [Mycobacterium nebraskense]
MLASLANPVRRELSLDSGDDIDSTAVRNRQEDAEESPQSAAGSIETSSAPADITSSASAAGGDVNGVMVEAATEALA